MKPVSLFFMVIFLMAACSSGAQTEAVPASTLPPLPPTATFAPTAGPLNSLGLQGQIIYTQGADGLWMVDLADGSESQLWRPNEGGDVQGVSISPDGVRLALAYAPVVDAILRTDLYILNRDGSGLTQVLAHEGVFETYANPFWSPDGEWIYYTHADVATDETGSTGDVTVNIERIRPDGSQGPEIIIKNAEQPSISSDGQRLVYLTLDLENFQRGLSIADVDGSNARELVSSDTFFLIGAPRISPDGGWVVFGASGPPLETPQSPTSFWQEWFTVQPAQAHGLPWEIWHVPAEGGEMEPLTDWYTDNPWPAWSPDGAHLAALQPGGVFLLEETGPRFLGSARGHGEAVWAP